MIPHFDLPFRYVNGQPAQNDQDTLDDLTARVYAVAATRPGDLEWDQDFGLQDFTFEQQPISGDLIQAQIEVWEPDARLLVESAPDQFDAAIARANIEVSQ